MTSLIVSLVALTVALVASVRERRARCMEQTRKFAEEMLDEWERELG